MKMLLTGFLHTIIAVAWGWEASRRACLRRIIAMGSPSGGTLPDRACGPFPLMSLAMISATRPGWLEAVSGMDRVYRLHKWSGILAVGFAALHWLVEMSDDLLELATVGRAGRIRKDDFGVCRTGSAILARIWANGPSTCS